MELRERGREIAWARAGSGPAVVFCHGTPWSSRLWRPFATELSRDFIDGAGHLVHYDAPVALMNELRVWLAQVDLQR